MSRPVVVLVLVGFAIETVGEKQHRMGPVELDSGYVGDWADWYGKWVIISFYAEWCLPCYDEVEPMNELHRKRDQLNLVVLGINWDGRTGTHRQRVKEHMGIKFPDVVGQLGQRWDREKPSSLPQTWIVGKNGNIYRVLKGVQTFDSVLAVIEPRTNSRATIPQRQNQ